MSEHQLYLCPMCRSEVEAVAGEIAREVACPHCGEMFMLPGEDAELDGNRIRRMAMLRRSTYRSGSYCLVAAGGCLGGAAEFVFHAVRLWRGVGGIKPCAYGVLMIFAAMGLLVAGGHFIRLARRIGHEAKRSALEEPARPPDFSGLRNGSQLAENLEKMGDGESD